MNQRSSIVVSIAGTSLSDDESAILAELKPFGCILFGRNIDTPHHLSALCAQIRDVAGVDTHILIDQEGGRVQRLKAPNWPKYPPMSVYGALYEKNSDDGIDAARLGGFLLGRDLEALGINVNCAPVLDLLRDNSHESAIGDRSFGCDVGAVSALGVAFAHGMIDAGVIPVVKHLPGHGAAQCDSHYALPVIEGLNLSNDFKVFNNFFNKLDDCVLGMTGHILLTQYDTVHPASASRVVLNDIVRQEIGFQGLLLSDDLDMQALVGYCPDLDKRIMRVLHAGCDIALYCSGKLEDLKMIADMDLPKVTKTVTQPQKIAINEGDLVEKQRIWSNLIHVG